MKKIKFYLILTIFSLSSFITFSQNNTGSPYSINELGEISFIGNVSNISMGGISASIDSIEFNIDNPSSLAKLKTTNYQVGTFFRSSGISNSNATDRFNSANINYIAIGIPVKNFGFSFGVLPYSSVGFNLQSTEEFNSSNSINTRLFGADGNINRVFFSLGLPILKYASIGGTVNYNFGKFNYEKFNQYQNLNYGIFSNSSSEITGFNYSLSSSLSIPLAEDIFLNFVYIYSPSSDLNSFNIESLYTASSSIINLENLGDFVDVDLKSKDLENTKLLIPQKSIFSFGFEKKNSWLIGLQYENKISSSFENLFLKLNNITYRDSNSLSFGGYYIPDASSLTSYWDRVVYRFGFKREQKSIIVNNLPVNHFSLNLGLGLPLSGLSKANLGLDIGAIGDDKSVLKENYFALRLGLSLNDIWFIRRKFN